MPGVNSCGPRIAWEKTLQPNLATGIYRRSYTGRGLMSIERGLLAFKYHCE